MTSNGISAKANRSSNFELLRIICMVLIIAHHFALHSDFSANTSSFNSDVIKLFSAFGKVGVNVFVLITGYFLVESKFKIRRLINVVALTVFYSVATYLSVTLFTSKDFVFSDFVHRFFPIYYDEYWFVKCFVAFSLLSPFINKMLHALTRSQHALLIALLLLMQVCTWRTTPYFTFSKIGWFITLYIMAAYVRLYPNKIFDNKLISGISFIGFSALTVWLSNPTLESDLFCLAASASLFCLFKSINISSHRLINLLGRVTFGIYLIHDSKIVRPRLWNNILKTSIHTHLDTFWLYAILCVLIVFIACMLIELVRIFGLYLIKRTALHIRAGRRIE